MYDILEYLHNVFQVAGIQYLYCTLLVQNKNQTDAWYVCYRTSTGSCRMSRSRCGDAIFHVSPIPWTQSSSCDLATAQPRQKNLLGAQQAKQITSWTLWDLEDGSGAVSSFAYASSSHWPRTSEYGVNLYDIMLATPLIIFLHYHSASNCEDTFPYKGHVPQNCM